MGEGSCHMQEQCLVYAWARGHAEELWPTIGGGGSGGDGTSIYDQCWALLFCVPECTSYLCEVHNLPP